MQAACTANFGLCCKHGFESNRNKGLPPPSGGSICVGDARLLPLVTPAGGPLHQTHCACDDRGCMNQLPRWVCSAASSVARRARGQRRRLIAGKNLFRTHGAQDWHFLFFYHVQIGCFGPLGSQHGFNFGEGRILGRGGGARFAVQAAGS